MSFPSKISGKLLCSSADYDLYSVGCRLIACVKSTKESVFLGALPESGSSLSHLRPVARLLRLDPRCGLFISGDTALVCCHGRIFRLGLSTRTICEEHRFRPGMSSPLSLTLVKDNPGFDDCVVYGDYINDNAENETTLYCRSLQNPAWAPVFSFASGRVKHVHTVLSCPQRESLIVFTGDSDTESGIWEIEKGFRHARQIVGGSQQFRACVGFVTESGIVYATDAPNEPNALFFCDFDGGSRRKLADLAGPAIYGAELPGGRYVFSTSVEPARESGLLSWLSYRRGRGVRDNRSHVYLVESGTQVKEIFSAKKDWLPMRLFGYGTFQFPAGSDGKVRASGQALSGLNGKTVLLSRPACATGSGKAT